jgi:hypothetical protein
MLEYDEFDELEKATSHLPPEENNIDQYTEDELEEWRQWANEWESEKRKRN